MSTEERLFYVLKISHLRRFEQELRAMRNSLNALHELELRSPCPDTAELERMDRDYINLLASVQGVRAAVEPLATSAGIDYGVSHA